jgi:hypothetical protein
MKRRAFVRLAVSAVALSPFHRVTLSASSSPLPEASLATLRSLAPVVLPTALGRRGIELVTDRFLAWLAGYRPGVVMEHGYGRPRVRRTPDSPAPRYVEQLNALQDASAQQHRQAFSRLPAEAKLGLIEAAFKAAGIDTLPGIPNGRHVVADLMAFYFQSSEANDHCYQAAIGRETCRPLSQVTARPRPLF